MRQSRVAFTDEANHFIVTDETDYHISKRVIRHNCLISGSDPRREHLERERDNPTVNVLYWLTHETVMCPFFFDEDISTGNSLLNILEVVVALMSCLPCRNLVVAFSSFIMQSIVECRDPLLDNDRESINETTPAARQQILNK
jgi:hypothetical protein